MNMKYSDEQGDVQGYVQKGTDIFVTRISAIPPQVIYARKSMESDTPTLIKQSIQIAGIIPTCQDATPSSATKPLVSDDEVNNRMNYLRMRATHE